MYKYDLVNYNTLVVRYSGVQFLMTFEDKNCVDFSTDGFASSFCGCGWIDRRNGRRNPRNTNKNDNILVVIDRHSPKSKAVENVDILQYSNKLYSINHWD